MTPRTARSKYDSTVLLHPWNLRFKMLQKLLVVQCQPHHDTRISSHRLQPCFKTAAFRSWSLGVYTMSHLRQNSRHFLEGLRPSCCVANWAQSKECLINVFHCLAPATSSRCTCLFFVCSMMFHAILGGQVLFPPVPSITAKVPVNKK